MKTLSRIALWVMVAMVLLRAHAADPFQETPVKVKAQGALRAAGLLVYGETGLTPDQYATATEFTSAEVFSTVINFVAPDGAKFSVVNSLIYARIDYDGKRPEAFQDILQENDLAPVEAAIKTLDGISERFARSRKYLSPLNVATMMALAMVGSLLISFLTLVLADLTQTFLDTAINTAVVASAYTNAMAEEEPPGQD